MALKANQSTPSNPSAPSTAVTSFLLNSSYDLYSGKSRLLKHVGARRKLL